MKKKSLHDELQARTINDFGKQWVSYRDNEEYYGSLELFDDLFQPLLKSNELKGAKVADIGSGTGRIVQMLINAGAAHVTAVEPSEAFEVLRENTHNHKKQITLIHAAGDRLPPTGDLDYVFSLGVLHHIPNPDPVMKAAYKALRPGGRIAIWLYGKEGNRLYLFVFNTLRVFTKHLPHFMLVVLSWALYIPLIIYMNLCKWFPFPMRTYMTNHLGRLTPAQRRLTIYDQLNPAYAKYYTRQEAYDLVKNSGFEQVKIHQRHGYSWTVIGTKPFRS